MSLLQSWAENTGSAYRLGASLTPRSQRHFSWKQIPQGGFLATLPESLPAGVGTGKRNQKAPCRSARLEERPQGRGTSPLQRSHQTATQQILNILMTANLVPPKCPRSIFEQPYSDRSHLPLAFSLPRQTSGASFSQTAAGGLKRSCHCVCLSPSLHSKRF